MEVILKEVELRLKHEFKISRGGSEKKLVYLLKVFDKEHYGLGEIAPYPYYGQTKELVKNLFPSVEHTLKKRKAPKSIDDINSIMNKVMDGMYGQKVYLKAYNHILSGVSSALIDLYCKKKDLTLEKFIKEYLKQKDLNFYYPLSSYTLGIDSPQMLKVKIDDASQFKVLKVKLGATLEQDQDTIDVLRSITDLPIRVDANCGWTLDETMEMAKFLENKNIEFIEQPMPSDNSSILDLHGKVKLPIFFDESIVSVDDIEKVAGFCDGINIKMSKCGGLISCLEMIKRARELNLKLMLGCMIETGVGINFGYVLSGLVDYADLDGNILINNDPFEGQGNFTIVDGRITKKDHKPGIGIEVGNIFD